MRRFASLMLIGLGFAVSISGADESPTTALFHSPKNQFDVRFQTAAQRLYPTPYERALAPGTKSHVYSVSFYLAGENAPAAMTYFTDIQQPNAKFPTPLDVLFKNFVWSPEEDFVILPRENWPTAQGEVIPRQAISLRTSSVWQTADFPLQLPDVIWLNPLQVIGNHAQGCRHDVQEFDGGSGRTILYQGADPPEGYEILSHDADKVVLKKVLGDCATDADQKNFRPECLIMNVSFGRREIGACPR